jgi:hypothetical protein
MAQNLMSVAASLLAAATEACAAAATAARLLEPWLEPLDTAFRLPALTVDFSVCEALIVRR